MARIRSFKPSMRTSRVVLSWPFEVRYFWALLWGYLDDHGRGVDSLKAISGDCYPLEDAVTPARVGKWLELIASSKVEGREAPLCRYEVGGARYLHAINWGDNQKVNRPKPSLIPPCPVHEPITEEITDSGREDITDDPRAGRGKGEGGSRKGEARFTEPDSAPARYCPKHPTGTTDRCGPCGDARKAFEAWEADRRARLAAAPKCPDHPDQPAHNCGSCRADRLAGDVA